jgi:transcriptional regulator with PAS, ATPase and Fis domain
MASIPKEMAESELFGHSKGAFTGAINNKAGLIELAHNGIFFLDELGECDLSLQAKLLRVINEKEFRAVGDVKTKTVNVRFISATNRDLEKMANDQTFRLDLLHRLNTVELHIPPLRERPEDIILYTNKFLLDLSKGKSFHLTSDAIDTLISHTWPGNIRELRSVIEKLIIKSEKLTIDGELVLSCLKKDVTQEKLISNELPSENNPIRSKVLKALELENGNRTKAAARLSIHTVTLQRWMNKLGIRDIYKSKSGRPSGLSALQGIIE